MTDLWRAAGVNPPTEEWRAVPGREGIYEVSNIGRVRSVPRRVQSRSGVTRSVGGRILAIVYETNRVRVRLERANKIVATLVVEAFIGPRPNGMEVCHNNGNGHDNRVENLRWDTHSSNMYDLVRHGVHVNARKTHCKHGHEFTPANTIARRDHPGRTCRTCQRARTRAARAKKSAA